MTTTDVRFATATPVIPVDDLATAIAFYRDALGFNATFEQGAYGGVQRDAVELHLDASDLSRKLAGTTTVRVSVDGIDTLYAAVEPSGAVNPAEPLETKPWVTRQFSVRDNCGNRVTFVQTA